MKGYNKSKPQQYRSIIKELLGSDSITRDDSFIRIHYTRYADDFVIGIIGSYTIAKEILEKVENFVNSTLKLKFNPDKTAIIDFYKESFKFLGYTIKTPMSKIGQKPLETITINGKVITRIRKIRPSVQMDTEKVLKKLKNNGFIRMRISHTKHREMIYRGKFKGNLVNFEHPYILKYYNSVIRGIQNYYSFSRNRIALARIGWLIKESCALTLARKFKLKTLAKVFQKFGKDLGYSASKDKRISIQSIEYTRATNIAKVNRANIDPLQNIEKVWNAKFTKSNIGAPCVICGSTIEVEMHHVRQIRDMKDPNKKLDFYTRQMAAMNRKQVPLCRNHHISLHNDTWTESEKAIFKYEAKGKKK